MFDVIEIHKLISDPDKLYVPWRIDKGDPAADLLDTFDRVVSYDQLNGKSIIGIDPIGLGMFSIPSGLRRIVC